jgi:transposase
MRVGVEACAISNWLCPELIRSRLHVICIEARHAHNVLKENTNKTDRNDARGIAELMRAGLYREVHIKSAEGQRLKALLTARRMIQIKVLDLENGIGGVLRSFGLVLARRSTSRFDQRVRALLKGKPDLGALIEPLMEARRVLRETYNQLDALMRAAAKADPVCQRLMTAPGIGPIAALTYRVVIEVPERFRRSQTVGAHLGLTPKSRQSGEKDMKGRISRRGDRTLRVALFNGANAVLNPQCRDHPLRSWALKIAARRGRMKAVVALARRLSVILHRMWVDGTDYEHRPVAR